MCYNRIMKYLLCLSMILIVVPVYAGSINPVLYSAMQRQTYRNNYNRQVNYKAMPYWQAQSNYTTRNRFYSDYRSYNNYANYMHQYNSNMIRSRY